MTDKPVRKQLTEFRHSGELIISGYGTISYSDWCVKEAERINKSGRTMAVGRDSRGYVALFDEDYKFNWL